MIELPLWADPYPQKGRLCDCGKAFVVASYPVTLLLQYARGDLPSWNGEPLKQWTTSTDILVCPICLVWARQDIENLDYKQAYEDATYLEGQVGISIDDPKRYISSDQAADRLGLTRSRIVGRCIEGRYKGAFMGIGARGFPVWRIPREEIEREIANLDSFQTATLGR